MPDQSARHRKWFVLAVVLAASVPYLFNISDYFLQDDFGVVQLFARRPWTMFPRWFVMPWTENIWGYTPDEIRPFVALTYQLTGKWNPARPELHHIFNIAMHVANALLVMAIARVSHRSVGRGGCLRRDCLFGPARAGRERGLDHRPRRLDADVLLPGDLSRLRALAARSSMDRTTRLLSRCSSSRCSANRTRSRWRRRSLSTTSSFSIANSGVQSRVRFLRGFPLSS